MISLSCADARRIPLPDESVQAVITSPPYWGLRDYGLNGRGIGLEASPAEYVAQMVAVFREVWRVLRKDGTVWLNLGDSYAQASERRAQDNSAHQYQYTDRRFRAEGYSGGVNISAKRCGLKPKDLCMIPARVALALQKDGWWLRSDIIWAKGVSFCPTYSGSVMPESVTDRPSQSYEHVFLLAKSKRYYYDADAVREAPTASSIQRNKYGQAASREPGLKVSREQQPGEKLNPAGRNLRSVWTINPKPSKLAHYAAFPPALVEPMVLASTSERGCCPECGKGWERVVERTPRIRPRPNSTTGAHLQNAGGLRGCPNDVAGVDTITTGWRPGCTCGTEHPIPQEELDADPSLLDDFEIEPFEPVPCTVLDCFGGTMTVGEVCAKHGRHFIGLDLKREYVEMGRERVNNTQMAMAGLND